MIIIGVDFHPEFQQIAGCPRFASVFWTLTWVEEDPDWRTKISTHDLWRPLGFDLPHHFGKEEQNPPPLGVSSLRSQVSPKEGRTWGTRQRD